MVDFSLNKKLLFKVLEEGLSWTHSYGYYWFHNIFMPTLEKVAETSEISNENLSSCYYIAGDIADANSAPNKALEYYHKALSFNPSCAATYREIANMLCQIGKYDESLEYSDKALALDPHDEHAIGDRYSIFLGGPPLFEEGNTLWKVCEHLANADPRQALTIVKDMNDVIGLRGKSYCYGALDDTDKYLNTWSKLTQISDEISLELADWFFMPEHIHDSPDIWTILLSSKAEFSGHATVFDSLQNNSTYQAFTDNDRIRLSFQYQKHVVSKNYTALKYLLETYPEWVELKDHIPSNL